MSGETLEKRRRCIAESPIGYFSSSQAVPCGGRIVTLPNFWMSHPSGNLDAAICWNHVLIARHFREYLGQKVQEALAKEFHLDAK